MRPTPSLGFGGPPSLAPAWRLGAAAVITALAFSRAFGLSRFYDDWFFASEADLAVRSHRFAAFMWQRSAQHWSPLWQAFDFFNAWAIGWRTDLVIRGSIALVVFLGLIVFAWALTRCGASAGAVVAGMAVLGLHHLNAIGYYSFDCYSQVAADCCTWACVSLVIAFGVEGSRASRGRLIAAVAIYVPSLLVKEQGLAAMAGVTVTLCWFTVVEPLDADRRRALWIAWAAMLAWSAAFAALRFAAGLSVDADGPFRICLTCVPRNLALFLGALPLPLSTLYTYSAVSRPLSDPAVLAAAGAATAVVVTMMVFGAAAYGGERGRVRRRVALVGALMVTTLFPTVLLGDIGELYAHTALFWFAALVTMAVDGWRVRLEGSAPRVAREAIALVAVYIVALAVGLQGNLAEMRATGERAASWLAAFAVAIRPVPSGAVVMVRGLDAVKADGDYSLYRLTTPGMLLYTADSSLRLAAPSGLTVIDSDDWPDFVADHPDARRSRRFVADFSSGRIAVHELASGRP